MADDLVIRLARSDEQKALEALQWRASLEPTEYREALLAHPDAITLPLEQIETGRTFVAEREGEVLGFSVVLAKPDGDAELDGLFVEPFAWKQGIGRMLVEEAGRFAVSEGAQSLHVLANPTALGFYEACDFELIGEQGTRFGVGFVMRKRLRLGIG
jgi:GNAT superfamily N-acetyltransferase